MAWTKRLESLAREGYRTYKVAQDVAGSYGALSATVSSIQIGGTTFLVTALLTPVGVVAALILVPLWPWIFVLPALLMAMAMLAAAVTAYFLFRVLPRTARDLLANARVAGSHALERYDALRALAESRGWTRPAVSGNGHGTTPLVARPLDA